MSKKFNFFCAATILMFSFNTFAQPPENTPRPGFRTSTLNSSIAPRSQTSLGLALGSGEYPILELPQMEHSESRVDGSTSPRDIRINRGALLDLKLGWTQKSFSLPFSITAGAQRIASAPGSGIPTPSSYIRVNAEASSSFYFEATETSLIPSVETRRSMYRNVDTGHYVDAILLKSALEQKIADQFTIGLNAGIAPWTQFGLLQNSDRGKSGALSQTTAGMSEIGAKLLWMPEQSTSFHLGVAQESVTVRMDGHNSYQSYGLPVSTTTNSAEARSYDLSVRQFSVGTTKRF